MEATNQNLVIPHEAAAQLWLHTRLAAHHAAVAGSEPAAAEAILAWAILVASGGERVAPAMNAMPTAADLVEESTVLPAYRAAADQAEQCLTHFDHEERFELVSLYSEVISIIEKEIQRIESR
jgi:hypothetical protein